MYLLGRIGCGVDFPERRLLHRNALGKIAPLVATIAHHPQGVVLVKRQRIGLHTNGKGGQLFVGSGVQYGDFVVVAPRGNEEFVAHKCHLFRAGHTLQRYLACLGKGLHVERDEFVGVDLRDVSLCAGAVDGHKAGRGQPLNRSLDLAAGGLNGIDHAGVVYNHK